MTMDEREIATPHFAEIPRSRILKTRVYWNLVRLNCHDDEYDHSMVEINWHRINTTTNIYYVYM